MIRSTLINQLEMSITGNESFPLTIVAMSLQMTRTGLHSLGIQFQEPWNPLIAAFLQMGVVGGCVQQVAMLYTETTSALWLPWSVEQKEWFPFLPGFSAVSAGQPARGEGSRWGSDLHPTITSLPLTIMRRVLWACNTSFHQIFRFGRHITPNRPRAPPTRKASLLHQCPSVFPSWGI